MSRSCATVPIKGDLLIEAGVGWKPGVVGQVSFGADRHSAPGRSIQTGEPVIAEDIANDPEFRYADVLREHGIVSVLNVPIMVDGTHWGVLEVDTVEKTSFDEFETHSLSIFANIIGLSLAKDSRAGRGGRGRIRDHQQQVRNRDHAARIAAPDEEQSAGDR